MWARVTATIRPLSRELVSSSPSGGGEPAAKPAVEGASAPRPLRQRSAPTPRPTREGLATATLDSGWNRRLRSGAVEPDRILDLHGRTLDTAWRAIDTALEQAIGADDRVILLVTGHARPGAPIERGKIRAAVFDWLSASRHAQSIAAVRPAHRRHGGGGSLYIILRRKRPGCTLS